MLKSELKSWNVQYFGKIEDRIQLAVDEIKAIDDKCEGGHWSDACILKRR